MRHRLTAPGISTMVPPSVLKIRSMRWSFPAWHDFTPGPKATDIVGNQASPASTPPNAARSFRRQRARCFRADEQAALLRLPRLHDRNPRVPPDFLFRTPCRSVVRAEMVLLLA